MKKTYFIKNLLLASILAFVFVACSDDDNEGRSDGKLELDKTGAFVLNEGAQGANNSTLSHYSIAQNKLITEIFKKQNDETPLGDTANDILIYGSKVFFTVTGSHMIFVTDLDGVIIKEISTKEKGYENPRYMIEHDGYIYIDFYSGHLAKLDPATYNIETLSIPTYSEQMTVANNELYITNSTYYVNSTTTIEGKTVTVVDLKTFKVKGTPIEVRVNPNKIVSDTQGNVYVVSWGWGAEQSALSVIKAGTYEAEVITDNISKMAIQGNKILLFNTIYGASQTTAFSQYDLTTGEYSTTSFLTTPADEQAAALLNLAYYISVNPLNNDIYVSTTDYVTTGSVLIFDKDGKYKSKFTSGGINPQKVEFIKKK